MICMVTYGNGVRICMMMIMMKPLTLTLRGIIMVQCMYFEVDIIVQRAVVQQTGVMGGPIKLMTFLAYVLSEFRIEMDVCVPPPCHYGKSAF